MTPVRLLETRPAGTTGDGLFAKIGERAAGSITAVQVGGRLGIPTDAAAVVLNVVVTSPHGAGFATVFPCGSDRPNTANVNYRELDTISNLVVVGIGSAAAVCFFTYAAADFVVDVSGWFPAGSPYAALVPARLADSRPGYPTADGVLSGFGQRPAGTVTEIAVAGRGGVSADASVAVLNIAVADPLADGFLTVFPCGSPRPNAASMNYHRGEATSSGVITGPGSNGNVCVFTYATTDLVVDVNGFVPGP